MHIRLLLLTYFLQFFPDLVKMGHVYILETPLFRVRNKKKTLYCYDDEERNAAVEEVGKNPEITCLLYTSPSPRDLAVSRMPSSA